MDWSIRICTVLIAWGGGFWAQAYSLPRIGLQYLEVGEYTVWFAMVVITLFLVGVGRYLTGDSD